MELKDFVSDVLSGIAQGIAEAQQKTSTLGGCLISPRHMVADQEAARRDSSYQIESLGDSLECVDFDIAVTTKMEGEAKGQAKVFVVDAALNADIEHAHTSRVSFKVFVRWPRAEEQSNESRASYPSQPEKNDEELSAESPCKG